MSAPLPVRWAVSQGVPRLLLSASARRGELASRITTDPALRADPFAAYDALREQGPLVRGRLATATADHAVVSEVLRSPAFGVGTDSFLPNRFARRVFAATLDPRATGPVEPPSMLAVDPPTHTRYRRLVSKVFTARAVASLEGRVQDIADELLDGLAGDSEVDLVARYAGQLPVRVICEVLGIPASARPNMLRWGNAAALTLDPGLSWAQYRRAQLALREVHVWLGEHLAALRRSPGPDLFSQLVGLQDQGERLSDLELRTTALLVVGAGFETTVNLLGSGVADLVAHPDQLERLQAEPAGWTTAVEEVLRFDSPVQVTVRVPREDTVVAGQKVGPGRLLLLMLGGANRDPAVFADPHRFDTTRANAREHLAFSGGVHFCLGAGLARTEGAVGLRSLFARYPALTLAAPPVRRPMRVLRGYSAMPVRLGPRVGAAVSL